MKIAEATLGVVNEAVRSRESEEKLLMLSEKLEFAGVDAVSELFSGLISVFSRD